MMIISSITVKFLVLLYVIVIIITSIIIVVIITTSIIITIADGCVALRVSSSSFDCVFLVVPHED